jgi:multidrug efflux pump subunit AcrB
MGGLAVAIGLVIDDAVVVVENIYRHLDRGENPGQAVHLAMKELIAPVVGSTLTTVVVFVPLGMLSGVIGQFFRALSITLASAVLISLVQALTLIPLLARWAAKSRDKHAGGDGKAAHEHKTGALERFYSRTLDATMHRPALGIVIALVLAIAGGLLFMRIGTGFLPGADEGGFVVDYNAPAGSALPEIDRVVRKMEAVLKSTPEIAAFTRRTGSELGFFATRQTKGDILVRLKPAGQRKAADEVINDLRDKLQEAAPGFEIEFVQLLQDMLGDLEGAPTPIEVKVFGDSPDTLADISEQIEGELEKVPGVVDLVGVQRGNPETTWDLDPAAIGRLGLNVTQVSEQLSDAWLGDVRTELRLSDRTIPVRVRYPDAYRMDPQRMAETPVRAQDGRTIPLGSLAHSTTTEGELILERENLRQMAIVTGRLEGRDLGSAVAEIKTKLAALKLPVGYTAEVGGQYASQRQAFRELLTVFAIAAALVFIILVVQFRSFLPAVLILLAAPLSLAGAFALLLLTGIDLNVSSAMGLILLVGLVVKNGIVLLDYAHRLRDEGTPFTEALEIAGRVRLRPILMTTLCTLFGLLPLALGLGAGAELQRPLALAVIGGLTLSTFVTLFLVPVAYRALSRSA